MLVIHCTRMQVSLLAGTVAKIHLNIDGTKYLLFPKWIRRMYHAAKVNDYRQIYNAGNRMITH